MTNGSSDIDCDKLCCLLFISPPPPSRILYDLVALLYFTGTPKTHEEIPLFLLNRSTYASIPLVQQSFFLFRFLYSYHMPRPLCKSLWFICVSFSSYPIHLFCKLAHFSSISKQRFQFLTDLTGAKVRAILRSMTSCILSHMCCSSRREFQPQTCVARRNVHDH